MDFVKPMFWFALFYCLSYALTFVLIFMFNNKWIQIALVSAPLAALLLERKRRGGETYR